MKTIIQDQRIRLENFFDEEDKKNERRRQKIIQY